MDHEINDPNMTAEVHVNAFDKKVIYVYKHLDVKSHEGWLKVGETKASRITGSGTNMRILEQNTAANVAYEVLYTTDAVRNNGTPFSDSDIHDLLVAKDIEREDTINPETKRKSEWFKTDLDTIVEAIENYKMDAVKDVHGIITSYNLRDEQKEAVSVTVDYYDKCQEDGNIDPQFLWNAKPRFGKTLTAYSFASAISAKKVLIVTNRPAIADSWYSDFKKFDFKDTDQQDGKFRWIFTSSEPVKKRLGDKEDIFTRDEQKENPNLLAKNMIHFISFQDIKGTMKTDDGLQAFKEKNRWIFELNWDLVIIDESHEASDTRKALRVFETANTNFILHLSGTPFKAIANNRFNSKQIYNWSYQDEQNAKNEWPIQDGQNPYAELPKMHIFTYQLSKILETTAEEAKDEGSEYAFDLSEFFRVIKDEGEDKFAYEEKVKLFIKNLSNPEYQYPFSKDEFRDSLRHTFWLLPGVKACEQMKKLLLEDDYFKKNYAPEDIIMAAGNGDEDRLTNSALAEVRRRIGEPGTAKHPLETRTITLSCGQLTTGVTVPAWTAVLMLNNCKSPSLYMQSAFRAQNPFKVGTSGGECFIKENCFVFDFAPDRILQTLAEIADSGVSETPTRTREEKVKILINFLPVIAEDDEGKMKYLSANEVLTIPLKLITEEVINRGFMSNRLFKNISGIFGCPQDIKDIIAKMDEAKTGRDVERDPAKKNKVGNKPKVWIDADKKIHINEDIVVATTNGLLGDKKYVEIGTAEGKEIEETIGEAVSQARAAGYSPEAIKAVKTALTKKMPKLVVKAPDPEPQPGEPGYVDPPEAPDEKPAPKEKSEEEKVRDRLRGFARTIPSFLMAYGSADTKLENFGDDIPDDVFEEISSITKEDFRKLRDGMDYQTEDENGNPKTAHFDGLFNEDVFNSSIQAFNEKRKELACYYQTNSEEDIFEYIPPQANNQIFTPKRVVKMMVDMLEEENPGIFNSTTNTFIDLYMKSGMYITEVVKRIYENTREQYRNDTECVQHILEKQVYGFAPTPILDAITRNYIFGFDPTALINESNFVQYDTVEAAKSGTLEQEVNRLFNKQGEPMKFTAVIGNPPYQGDNHQQLYPDFYLGGRIIAEKLCLIFPTGWQEPKTANNLAKLNTPEIKEDPQIVFIDNRQNVFAGITGAEWTNIIMWKKGYDNGLHGKQLVRTDGINPEERQLVWDKSDLSAIVPYETLLTISNKVLEKNKISIDTIIESQTKFNLDALYEEHPELSTVLGNDGRDRRVRNDAFEKINLFTEEPTEEEEVKIFGLYERRRVERFIPKRYLDTSQKSLMQYKVLLPEAAGVGFGCKLSKSVIAKPNEGLTQTFISFGGFDKEQYAENCAKYIRTKFARALLGILKITRRNNKAVWKYVPLEDFTEKSDIDWSRTISEIDKQLYDKYNLSEDEINFIEEKVAEME